MPSPIPLIKLFPTDTEQLSLSEDALRKKSRGYKSFISFVRVKQTCSLKRKCPLRKEDRKTWFKEGAERTKECNEGALSEAFLQKLRS